MQASKRIQQCLKSINLILYKDSNLMQHACIYILYVYCVQNYKMNWWYWLSWSHHFKNCTVATMTWLTVMEYLCHKWPRICSACRKHFPVLSSFMTYHPINTKGVTSEAGTETLPVHPNLPPVFSGVRVTRSLVLCVCFIDRCLSFSPFSFDHCVVCPSFYGFWLPLWYLQTLL